MGGIVGLTPGVGATAPPPVEKRQVLLKLVQSAAQKVAQMRAQAAAPPPPDPGPKTMQLGKMTGAGDPGADPVRAVEDELGKDAFLQLLVLQLRNQDPLNPQDNQEMLAQLAQFSSLEQMNNLNENFNELTGNIDQLNFINATGLLGHRVSGLDINGIPREGIVEGVHLDGSIVTLTVDGELMSMAGVLQIDKQPVSE